MRNGIIYATDGSAIYVDVSTYQWAHHYRWNVKHDKRGVSYACAHWKRPDGSWTKLALHRLIAAAARGTEVDHVDRNGLNNLQSNLRLTDRCGNTRNRRSFRGSTSQYKGVSWSTRDNVWRAQIQVDGRGRFLGNFLLAENAARAYDREARSAFGEFAVLNFPSE